MASKSYKSYDDASMNLSTLAAGTSIKVSLKADSAREQGVRIKKIRYIVNMIGKQNDEGPLRYGLCSSDLTIAQLDECLDSDPQHAGEVPGTEEANRQVVLLGAFGRNTTSTQNDPSTLRSAKWFWDVIEGTGLQFWVRNDHTIALTTGCAFDFHSFMSGDWLDD